VGQASSTDWEGEITAAVPVTSITAAIRVTVVVTVSVSVELMMLAALQWLLL
jgi:hypothetical protein